MNDTVNGNNIFEPLNLGFVGGGLSSSIGPAHFAACGLDKRWKLVAGAFSSNNDINLSTGNNWQITNGRFYNDWRSMIESEATRIDAVVVLLPTPDHCEVILELIRHGIAVICEKPLVQNLEEAYLIKSEIEKTNGFLVVTYNYSAYPMVRELKELIKLGSFGEINKIKLEMPQEIFLRVDPNTGKHLKTQDWRLRDAGIPTICHDLGTHLYHLTRFLMAKKPLRTAGRFSNHSKYQDLVDDIMMWVDFEGGLLADFWMSKSALGNRNGLKMRVFGTEGSAEWSQTEPEYLLMGRANGDRLIIDRGGQSQIASEKRYNRYKAGHPSGFIEAFANLYFDIADAFLEYRHKGKHSNPFVFGIEHSIESLLLFDALLRANESGSWENLSQG